MFGQFILDSRNDKKKASYCGQVGSKVGWLGLVELGKPTQAK